jgi:hypothetical protein
MTKAQPRLFVLMRPGCDDAVVLRQGPSKVFCVLGWNLATDKVVVGQWCKHKIYVERCDISSDGKYLVYFALDGKWGSEAKGAWTAVSYAPYLKALKLYPHGSTWGGGGMFFRDRETAPANVAAVWDDLEQFGRDRRMSHLGPEAMCERDGWTRTRKAGWRKPLTNALAIERRNLGEKGARYALVDGETVSARPGWTWADLDPKRKRLLWAEEGVLYQARIGARGLGKDELIFDTREMTFEAISAPYKNKPVIVGP